MQNIEELRPEIDACLVDKTLTRLSIAIGCIGLIMVAVVFA